MHTNTQMNTITIIKTTVIFCQLSIRMLKAIGAAAAVSRIKCNSMNLNIVNLNQKKRRKSNTKNYWPQIENLSKEKEKPQVKN